MADSDNNFTPKEQLLHSIGKRMTELRKQEGFKNHEDFAFEKGINRSQYGKYEKGKSDLQVSSLIKIILSYKNMTVEKFFEGVEIPEEFKEVISNL